MSLIYPQTLNYFEMNRLLTIYLVPSSNSFTRVSHWCYVTPTAACCDRRLGINGSDILVFHTHHHGHDQLPLRVCRLSWRWDLALTRECLPKAALCSHSDAMSHLLSPLLHGVCGQKQVPSLLHIQTNFSKTTSSTMSNILLLWKRNRKISLKESACVKGCNSVLVM